MAGAPHELVAPSPTPSPAKATLHGIAPAPCDALLCIMDRHEGAGTWAAAGATVLAVAVSLGIALSGWAKDRRRRLEDDRARVDLATSRLPLHDCLKLRIRYVPSERHRGYAVAVRTLAPRQARIIEGVRRVGIRANDTEFVDDRIGHVTPLKSHKAALTRLHPDDPDTLNAVMFIRGGTGADDWSIDAAQVEVAILPETPGRALIRFRAWISPQGEDPKAVRLGRQKI